MALRVRSLTFLLILVVHLPSVQAAEPNWVGATILVKKPNICITPTIPKGEDSPHMTLTLLVYEVLAEKGQWIKVQHEGVEGWFERKDAVLPHDAMQYFTDRIRTNPKDAFAWLQRAVLWKNRGDLDAALKDCNESIRLDPKCPTAYGYRANIRAAQRVEDQAVKDIAEAIRLDPRCAQNWITQGLIWSQKQDYGQAIKSYEEAIRLAPKYAIPFYNRGHFWFEKQDYEQAIKDFDEAIRLDPKYASALLMRGNVWSKKRDYDRAIEDYDAAIQLDSKCAGYFFNRGVAWRNKGDRERAGKDFDEAIRLQPRYGMAFLHRGLIRFEQKQYAGAIEDYEEANRLEPGHPEMEFPLAMLLASCPNEEFRDGKRALELAKTACETTEWKNALGLSILAMAYAAVGDFENAVKWQEKALADKDYARESGEDERKLLQSYNSKCPLQWKDVRWGKLLDNLP